MEHINDFVLQCLVPTEQDAVEFCEIVKAYHHYCDHEGIVHRFNIFQLSSALTRIMGVDYTGKRRGVRINQFFHFMYKD